MPLIATPHIEVMIKTLHVSNLGIIREVVADLPGGLIVLTGETGAGKSLMVDAIALLAGERVRVDMVRQGAPKAVVEAVFDVSARSDLMVFLAEAGFEVEEGELRVSRIINADGGSKNFVQGRLVGAKELREIGSRLVTIASQHAYARISQPRERLLLLDAYAGLEAKRATVAQAYKRWRLAEERLEDLRRRAAERASREDYLRFVINQIEAVSPREGEVEELLAEREVLRQAERLKVLANAVADLLYSGERSACDILAKASKGLQEMASVAKDLTPFGQKVEAARIELRELAREIEAYGNKLALDPGRLQEMEERIDAIRALERRYGGSVQAVLATLKSAREELAALATIADDEERLSLDVKQFESDLKELCSALSKAREEAAKRLSEAVTFTLHQLGMNAASFEVAVVEREIGETGANAADFLVQTNPGEPVAPIASIASGGELSRITLALYAALSASAGTPVLVVDEVDTGLSGSAADKMGEVLEAVAKARQVLVVTHHGTVAARGNAHLVVSKREVNGRTEAEVAVLDKESRIIEIARMIGGQKITPHTIAHARELLDL